MKHTDNSKLNGGTKLFIQSKVRTYAIMLSLFCFFPVHYVFNPVPSLSPTDSASVPEETSESAKTPETVTITDQQSSTITCPDNNPDSNDASSVDTGDEKQQAIDFETETGAIVMKHIDYFYNNGGKGTIGIYIKELTTGFEYGCNESKKSRTLRGYFLIASTCKLRLPLSYTI